MCPARYRLTSAPGSTVAWTHAIEGSRKIQSSGAIPIDFRPAHRSGRRRSRIHKTTCGEETMALRDNTSRPPPEPARLDTHYGRIGISAVAAAPHYPSEARNPHAPGEPASGGQPAGITHLCSSE